MKKTISFTLDTERDSDLFKMIDEFRDTKSSVAKNAMRFMQEAIASGDYEPAYMALSLMSRDTPTYKPLDLSTVRPYIAKQQFDRETNTLNIRISNEY